MAKNINDGWVVVETVANDIEFSMVEGLLKTADIPVVKKIHGANGFLEIVLGTPLTGIDVLVPEDKFEEATKLLEAEPEENEETEED